MMGNEDLDISGALPPFDASELPLNLDDIPLELNQSMPPEPELFGHGDALGTDTLKSDDFPNA